MIDMNKKEFVLKILLVVSGVFFLSTILLTQIRFTGNVIIDNQETGFCDDDYVFVAVDFNGEFSLVDKGMEKGCIPEYLHSPDFNFEYKLESENQSLYSVEFDPSLLYSDALLGDDMEGGAEGAEETILLAAPSLEEAEKLNVYENGEKVLEVDIYDAGATSCRI